MTSVPLVTRTVVPPTPGDRPSARVVTSADRDLRRTETVVPTRAVAVTSVLLVTRTRYHATADQVCRPVRGAPEFVPVDVTSVPAVTTRRGSGDLEN